MSTIPVEIISPERIEYSVECEFVVLPCTDGEVGIMPGHTNLIAQLNKGIVTFHSPSHGNSVYDISAGFALVSPKSVKVYTTYAQKRLN